MKNLRFVKKQNFYPSGSVETSLLYYAYHLKGATKAAGATSIVVFDGKICNFYVPKKGVESLRNHLLRSAISVIEKAHANFTNKWASSDRLLYNLALKKNTNWKIAWRRLNNFARELWLEAYKVECMDNFAEDLERRIQAGLVKAGIDPKHLHAIITPEQYTAPQLLQIDLDNLKKSRISWPDFAKKHWYIGGTWYGGKFLSKQMVEELTAQNHLPPKLDMVITLHNKFDHKLDSRTLKLVKILRILTVWREERKVQLQKINLGYLSVVNNASKELKIPKQILAWTEHSELPKLFGKIAKIKKRIEYNVVTCVGKGNNGIRVFCDDEAKKVIQEFRASDAAVTSVRGTVASRGVARGNVSLVLTGRDFKKFVPGSILVTTMTRPEFVPLMKKASGVITDEGGLTCHAAIVSRELKIPCVVGTGNATLLLQNGDLVQVDASKGIVEKLN